MLVGLDGRPLGGVARVRATATANPLTEERVNAELGALDSLLHLRWMPHAIALQDGRREGRYALCSYWPEVDPRRQWVRDGEYDPSNAFDILGWFCEDLHDANTVPVAPESILRKVLDLLHRCDNEKFPWRGRMAEVIRKNERQKRAVVQEAVDEIKDDAATQYYHSNRATRVFMNQGGR